MIELFVHGKTFLPETKALWRILMLCAVIQLTGGVFSIYQNPFEIPFINFWYGGAIATLPGILLGVAWEWTRDSSNVLNHKGMLGFYVFIGILLLIFALVIGESNAL